MYNLNSQYCDMVLGAELLLKFKNAKNINRNIINRNINRNIINRNINRNIINRNINRNIINRNINRNRNRNIINRNRNINRDKKIIKKWIKKLVNNIIIRGQKKKTKFVCVECHKIYFILGTWKNCCFKINF